MKNKFLFILGFWAYLPLIILPQTNGNKMNYFSSPKEAFEITQKLLQNENWKTLSSYYSLKDTKIQKEQLLNGSFFQFDSSPEVNHPSSDKKIKQPFDPSFDFDYVEENNNKAIVWLIKKIPQGDGQVQIGISNFRLIKTKEGYQLLPQNEND